MKFQNSGAVIYQPSRFDPELQGASDLIRSAMTKAVAGLMSDQSRGGLSAFAVAKKFAEKFHPLSSFHPFFTLM